MFSGAYPSEHGVHGRAAVRRDQRVASLRAAVERQGSLWMPEALRLAGYRTWGVSANPWISEPMGMSFGFEEFVPVGAAKARPRGGVGTERRSSDRIPGLVRRPLGRVARQWVEWRGGIDSGGDKGVQQAARMIGSRDPRPWFGFVNLMEAHVPYAPPRAHNELKGPAGLRAPAVSRKRRSYENTLRSNLGEDVFTDDELATIRALYRGEIRYLDELVGRLLDAIPDDTIVVITADHGEALGEHHQLDHQVTMIEEVLRVPLIVLAPERPEVPPFDSIRQVPELMASYAGLDVAGWRERGRVPSGVAVAEYESTIAHDRRSVGVARSAGLAPEKVALLESEMAAVTEGDHKLMEVAGVRTLVSLPDETPSDEPEMLARLGVHLDGARSVVAEPPPDEGYTAQEGFEIEERLEQLGYM